MEPSSTTLPLFAVPGLGPETLADFELAVVGEEFEESLLDGVLLAPRLATYLRFIDAHHTPIGVERSAFRACDLISWHS